MGPALGGCNLTTSRKPMPGNRSKCNDRPDCDGILFSELDHRPRNQFRWPPKWNSGHLQSWLASLQPPQLMNELWNLRASRHHFLPGTPTTAVGSNNNPVGGLAQPSFRPQAKINMCVRAAAALNTSPSNVPLVSTTRRGVNAKCLGPTRLFYLHCCCSAFKIINRSTFQNFKKK